MLAPSQLIASMVPDPRLSMVKLLQNFVEPVVQQSGQTGPIALLHVPVAQHRNNSDFLPNQISQIHKTVQLPPIPAVSIFLIAFLK